MSLRRDLTTVLVNTLIDFADAHAWTAGKLYRAAHEVAGRFDSMELRRLLETKDEA